jgi:glutamate racemase
MKIGVFDSGVGGLTVLSELLKVSKGNEFFYLGDTARVPYGIRSTETVIKYALECGHFLSEFDIDLLVVACNTVSAKALDALKKEFPHLEIFGVIEPAVERVVKISSKSVGVIGTPATVKSEVYRKGIKKLKPTLKVFQKATPLLVPLAEEGLTKGPVAESVLNHYLKEWESKIDTLLLGCTHYPLLEETIKSLFPHWKVVNSAKPLAESLKDSFPDKEGKNQIHLFFTDRTAFLEETIKRIPLNGEIKRIEIETKLQIIC